MLRVLAATTLVCVLALGPAAADWVPRVVVRAGIGDADQEYGYAGLGPGDDGESLIGGYRVTREAMYVYDGIRGEVKVYSTRGTYLGVIEARRTAGSRSIPLKETVDIAVANGHIYVLCDFGDDDPRFRVYKFDAESGEALGAKHVGIGKLGTMVQRIRGRDQRVAIAGSVMLAGNGGDIDIFDQVGNTSYPIVRYGRFVNEVVEEDGLPGWAFGDDRIQQTRHDVTELVDKNGAALRLVSDDGSLIAVDAIDRLFAVTQRHDDGFRIAVRNDAGGVLGSMTPPRRQWRVSARPNAYQIYEVVTEQGEAALYEIYADDESVQLIRWGNP